MAGFLDAIKDAPLMRGDLQRVSSGPVSFASSVTTDEVLSSDVCRNPMEHELLTQTTLEVKFIARCYVNDDKWRNQPEWVQQTLGAELRRQVYGEIVEDLVKLRGEIYNSFGMCRESDKIVGMLLDTIGKMKGG